MEVGLALVDLVVDYTRPSTKETVQMLRRHQGKGENPTRQVLLRLDYVSAKSNAPDFETKYSKTLQRLSADFVGMDIVLDREALVEVKQFAAELQEQVDAIMPKKPEVASADEPDVLKGETEQTSLVGQKSTGELEICFPALSNSTSFEIDD